MQSVVSVREGGVAVESTVSIASMTLFTGIVDLRSSRKAGLRHCGAGVPAVVLSKSQACCLDRLAPVGHPLGRESLNHSSEEG